MLSRQELEALEQIEGHPSIVHVMKLFEDDDYIYIV